MRRLTVLIATLVLVSACSSGPSAPVPSPTVSVCTDAFCLDVPEGWIGEVDETFVAFNHATDPEDTFLTASLINMEAIVENAGGSWPVTTDEVVRSFWALLEQAGVGELDRTQRMVGGAVRSWGTHETGDMWFVLVPVDSVEAVGVEIRGPNDTWETHADAVFPTVTP